ASAILAVGCSFYFTTTAYSEGGFRIAQTAAAPRLCTQVISCGTKDGKRKEYPNPCAAQDDGATNITPKTGPTCETARWSRFFLAGGGLRWPLILSSLKEPARNRQADRGEGAAAEGGDGGGEAGGEGVVSRGEMTRYLKCPGKCRTYG